MAEVLSFSNHFTELFYHNNNCCKLSYDGVFLAIGTQAKLIVRDVKRLIILNTFQCVEAIDLIKWSPDSSCILCSVPKKNVIQVWSVEENNQICKIHNGAIPFSSFAWSPDSKNILTVSDFNLRLSIWSLSGRATLSMPNPNLYAFSSSGKYLAIAERKACCDHLTLLLCDNWQLLKQYKCTTSDLVGMAWNSSDDMLAAWDSPLNGLHVAFYSLDGRHLGSYAEEDSCLGVKIGRWSPCGKLFVLGTCDDKVKVIQALMQKVAAEYSHSGSLTSSDSKLFSLVEKSGTHTSSCWYKYDLIEERPTSLQGNKVKGTPKFGVGAIEISADGTLIASVSESCPTTVWIYSICRQQIVSLIQHSQTIKCFSWRPTGTSLMMCCSVGALCSWNDKGCTVIPCPFDESVSINSVQWHPTGNCLILSEKEKSSIFYYK